MGVFRLLLVKAKAARRERWVPLDRQVSRVLGAYLTVRPAGSPWLFVSERGTPLTRAAVYEDLPPADEGGRDRAAGAKDVAT